MSCLCGSQKEIQSLYRGLYQQQHRGQAVYCIETLGVNFRGPKELRVQGRPSGTSSSHLSSWGTRKSYSDCPVSTRQSMWPRDGGHLDSNVSFGPLLIMPEKLGERSDGNGALPTSRPLTSVLAGLCHSSGANRNPLIRFSSFWCQRYTTPTFSMPLQYMLASIPMVVNAIKNKNTDFSQVVTESEIPGSSLQPARSHPASFFSVLSLIPCAMMPINVVHICLKYV